MKTHKEIKLPFCNLYVSGTKMDKNGNKVIVCNTPNQKGFSIQINGNLPKTASIASNLKEPFTDNQLEIIAKELILYIKLYGSKSQKEHLKVYSNFKV